MRSACLEGSSRLRASHVQLAQEICRANAYAARYRQIAIEPRLVHVLDASPSSKTRPVLHDSSWIDARRSRLQPFGVAIKCMRLGRGFQRCSGCVKYASSSDAFALKARTVSDASQSLVVRCRDVVTFSRLIKACGHQRWQQAVWYLAELRHSRLQQDIIPYSSGISLLTRARQWRAALQVFVELPWFLSPDAGTFSAALTACRIGSCWPLSLLLLEKAHALMVTPDEVGHNAIAAALTQGGQVEAALHMAKSVANFNSIIMSLRNQLAWPWALCVLDQMQRLRIAPNLGTFKSSASIFSEDKPDMILPLLQKLSLPQLDRTAHNMLMSSLEKCHLWKAALYYFHETSWEPPDLTAYNTAISACAKVGRWVWAIELLREMKQGAVAADEITFGSLISGTKSHWRLALELLQQGHSSQVRPSLVSMHSAVVACGVQWPKATYLLQESMQRRIVPDATMLGAVMSSLEKGQQWARCLRLLGLLAVSGGVDLAALSCGLSACAKAHRWEQTLHLLKVLAIWRIRPNAVVAGAALPAVASQPDGRYQQMAEVLLDSMNGPQEERIHVPSGGFTAALANLRDITQTGLHNYLAEDLVNLRDLPENLGRATMSDALNDAFIRAALKTAFGHRPACQLVQSSVQGLAEQLGLAPRKPRSHRVTEPAGQCLSLCMAYPGRPAKSGKAMQLEERRTVFRGKHRGHIVQPAAARSREEECPYRRWPKSRWEVKRNEPRHTENMLMTAACWFAASNIANDRSLACLSLDQAPSLGEAEEEAAEQEEQVQKVEQERVEQAQQGEEEEHEEYEEPEEYEEYEEYDELEEDEEQEEAEEAEQGGDDPGKEVQEGQSSGEEDVDGNDPAWIEVSVMQENEDTEPDDFVMIAIDSSWNALPAILPKQTG
ncbi:unnamed protein product [Effrenium voratum]|nr:unnamed protein product [Effrenium voratum]